MSIGKKLEVVADNLRDVYGRGKASGYLEGYDQGYTEGEQEGGIQAREYCLMQHFTDSVFGNGENELRIPIPFQPDLVTINTCNSYGSEIPNCFRGCCVDMRAWGRHMGNIMLCMDSGGFKSLWLGADTTGKYFEYKDGVFYCRFDSDGYQNTRWMPNVRYNVMAVRYPEENSKDLIREQIEMLPNDPPAGSSGTLTYEGDIIYTHFTEAEWNILTSGKPNWTFVLK